jgi:hypothetical protein
VLYQREDIVFSATLQMPENADVPIRSRLDAQALGQRRQLRELRILGLELLQAPDLVRPKAAETLAPGSLRADTVPLDRDLRIELPLKAAFSLHVVPASSVPKHALDF